MDATGTSPAGTVAVPAQLLADRFAGLRTAWLEIASDIATVGPVNELLMQRLDGLQSVGVAGEHELLSIAEDAAQVALQVTTSEGATTLSKRLRRAVYEYLLAVDAAASAAAFQASPTVAVVAQPARPGSMMIGLEEVAEVQPPPPPISTVVPWELDGQLGSAPEVDVVTLHTEDVEGALSTEELWAPGAEDQDSEAYAEQPTQDFEAAAHDLDAAAAYVEQEAWDADFAALEVEPENHGADSGETQEAHFGAFADQLGDNGAHPDQSEQFPDGGAEPEARVDATGDALPDVDTEEQEAAAVGDPDAVEAGTEPPAGRPQLTVIHRGYALAAPEPAGVPAPPPQGLQPVEPLGEGVGAVSPVPAARDYPPPPAAVVVPSYRAWADVIAAASEPAPEPAPLPEEADAAEPDGSHGVNAQLDASTLVLGDPDQPLLFEVAIEAPQFAQQPEPVADQEAVAPRSDGWPAFTPEGSSFVNGSESVIGWSVRKSPRQQLLSARMAEKRREHAMRAAQEAISEADKGKRRRDRDQEPLNAGAIPLQVEELIHRKKGADAASLLQRAAQELDMPQLVDVAMSAGDRLREAGQTKAAINCYLAAWRAAPLNEVPLWRLAEASLADHAVAQAVGHLQRIADLMRARGDDEGAITVYRRIATIAPDNKEVREVLRHLHATGRLLD